MMARRERMFCRTIKAGGHSLDNRVFKSVWKSSIARTLDLFWTHMRKKKDTTDSPPIKHELRTCCAFEGPLGKGRSVARNKRFFFAWRDGCLMGTNDAL
jgi:hypothetical protein